nr:GNAT family protein [Corynebacterium mendelii]
MAAYTPADGDDYLSFMSSLQLWDDPDVPYFFPWFRAFATDPEGQAHKSLERIASCVDELNPDIWDVPLLVRYRGHIIGKQDIRALKFARTRTISTASMLDLRYQGRGFGKLMRRAVLIVAFDHLGAQRAYTGAHQENMASRGVSLACGYRPVPLGDLPPLAEEIRPVDHDYFCVTPHSLNRAGVVVELSGLPSPAS